MNLTQNIGFQESNLCQIVAQITKIIKRVEVRKRWGTNKHPSLLSGNIYIRLAKRTLKIIRTKRKVVAVENIAPIYLHLD